MNFLEGPDYGYTNNVKGILKKKGKDKKPSTL